jgi:hypothetical protein
MTIIVNIPRQLEGFVNEKAAQERTSPEEFLLSLVEMSQSNECCAVQSVSDMSFAQREALEDTLEERSNGPFVPLGAGWKERVLAKATQPDSVREA